jgi:hypothetical protein
VLAYLSRYTHRVAISNRRLVACDNRGESSVSFRRLPCKSLSALHRTLPTRQPIAGAAYSLGSNMHYRQRSASRRTVTERRSDISVTLITPIDATDLSPSVQIPIAYRRC